MRGTVLFWVNHNERPGGFGFITPDGLENRRECNYWFGPRALKLLNGVPPKAGDRVEFEAGNFRPNKGPQCSHVTRILDGDERETITTLPGVDDVS